MAQAQMAKGVSVVKLSDTVANPIVEHDLGTWEVTGVVIQTVNQTTQVRTPATPAYTVLDRDRIQLTLAANAGSLRWCLVSA